MTELRERKKGASSPSTVSPSQSLKKSPGTKGGFSCVSVLLALVFVVGATVSTSFVLTKSLTFGYSIRELRQHIPILFDAAKQSETSAGTASETSGSAKKPAQNKVEKKLLTLTTEELRQFDGKDPNKPVYLAINGRVYDVTAGREKYYGPDGGYNFFSGVDAARAYITGCFQTHLTHDLRGLTQAEIDSLSTWSDFYENHDIYSYVGQVVHEPIPEDAPLPEPCT
ncbi:hypothetical protein CcCBS67573_g01981 [Chytriomyces confervae]|uniref:Cytochrome b5 heme-binding domain-containing protein n=1 Tax=Chytriomyces confervae TaxID=246404 RepID=A0A507FNZ9_9FUNG|nr:hypothetical protein HDU80_004673 [Chytriomyces hyalinus]TPX76747.1 hypothetical protein CcCBS67573_g01981 [Chytriomyces confervae]